MNFIKQMAKMAGNGDAGTRIERKDDIRVENRLEVSASEKSNVKIYQGTSLVALIVIFVFILFMGVLFNLDKIIKFVNKTREKTTTLETSSKFVNKNSTKSFGENIKEYVEVSDWIVKTNSTKDGNDAKTAGKSSDISGASSIENASNYMMTDVKVEDKVTNVHPTKNNNDPKVVVKVEEKAVGLKKNRVTEKEYHEILTTINESIEIIKASESQIEQLNKNLEVKRNKGTSK